MNRNSQKLRNLLLNLINKQKQDLTGLVSDPDVNFTRNRKIPYENMILSLLTMEGATLTNELLRQFGCSTTTATSSAFVQQRKKILPAALENLFQEFASQTARSDNYRGYKLLAIDGSDIQIATNPRDKASFFQTKEGVKPYNLLHLNALYNLLSHTYEDAIVYKAKEAGENKALIEMVDRSDFTTKTIVTADRGYESYNNMAHIQEKGWFYLIRVKDFGKYKTGILHGLDLPDTEEFDEYIDLNLTRKQTNEMKNLLQQKNTYRWLTSPLRTGPATSLLMLLPMNSLLIPRMIWLTTLLRMRPRTPFLVSLPMSNLQILRMIWLTSPLRTRPATLLPMNSLLIQSVDARSVVSL